MKNETIFWNYKTASKHMGIPIGTLYAMVSEERIPHIRIGPRHVLFPAQEVLDWLNQHLKTPQKRSERKKNETPTHTS